MQKTYNVPYLGRSVDERREMFNGGAENHFKICDEFDQYLALRKAGAVIEGCVAIVEVEGEDVPAPYLETSVQVGPEANPSASTT